MIERRRRVRSKSAKTRAQGSRTVTHDIGPLSHLVVCGELIDERVFTLRKHR